MCTTTTVHWNRWSNYVHLISEFKHAAGFSNVAPEFHFLSFQYYLVFLPGKIATIKVNALSLWIKISSRNKKEKNTIVHAIGVIINPLYTVIYFYIRGETPSNMKYRVNIDCAMRNNFYTCITISKLQFWKFKSKFSIFNNTTRLNDSKSFVIAQIIHWKQLSIILFCNTRNITSPCIDFKKDNFPILDKRFEASPRV